MKTPLIISRYEVGRIIDEIFRRLMKTSSEEAEKVNQRLLQMATAKGDGVEFYPAKIR